MEESGIARWFEYESGHAWCESAYKYQTLPYVAEFANTVSIKIYGLSNLRLKTHYL